MGGAHDELKSVPWLPRVDTPSSAFSDSSASPARLPLGLSTRLAAFEALERLSDLRGNAAAQGSVIEPAGPARRAWWVFVSTIGELNATAPLLDALRQRLSHLQMVLVTDHAHYRDSYLARYPDAEVVVSLGHSRDAAALKVLRPPVLMLVAEIPLLPSDAPCRCSAPFLLAARAQGALLVAVNGWLYGYAPSCRMDDIERRLLTRGLLGQFDALCVQTDTVQAEMLRQGAPAARLHVTGNLKLDALHQVRPWQAAEARSPALMQSIASSGRLAVVAGSLTRDSELQAVLDAFVGLRQHHPQALLVLAPRHPEVPANLEQIAERLATRGLASVRRSQLGDGVLPASCPVLVLDTMGELRDCYAVSTLAHVGVDHNVLEPLAYDKPTSVMPGWEATYPSYPVYTTLQQAGVLLDAEDAAGLLQRWRAAVDEGATGQALHRARVSLTRHGTSLQRHLAVLDPLLKPIRPFAAAAAP